MQCTSIGRVDLPINETNNDLSKTSVCLGSFEEHGGSKYEGRVVSQCYDERRKK